MTRRKPKPLRQGALAEMFAEMDRVYNGALEVIKRHPVASAVPDEAAGPAAPYKKAKSPRLTASANPEIAGYAQEMRDLKKTGLIRAIALAFPEASVAEIRASLPELNPSTVGIQVGKARKGG